MIHATPFHAPLAHHLSRFSAAPQPVVQVAAAEPAPEASEPVVTITASALDARIDSARAEVRAASEADHAAIVARVGAEQADITSRTIAAALAERDRQDGGAIAAQIAAATDALRGDLARQVADALRPLFATAVAARAACAVADVLARALAAPSAAGLVVRGPPALLAAIEAQLPEPSEVGFVPQEGATDVSVSGGDVCIRSRLAEALATLATTEDAA